MDLKRLRHLVALADEGNFARAAQRLNLSQPALSRSIQAAEAELEVTLFDRGTTEITPTPAGKFVLERARKLLFDSRCLERDIALYCKNQIGDLALGVGPFPAATLLPLLMPEMRQQHPAVRLRVEVNNCINLLERLRDEALDFFVADTSDLPHDADLSIVPLPRQYGGLFVRAGHPLLSERELTLPKAFSYGLATVHLPQAVRVKLAAIMRLDEEALPPLALECDDVMTLKHTALSSDTLLAVVHAAVVEEVDAGKLIPILVAGEPGLYSEMGIVSLRGRSHSPFAEMVIQRLIALSTQIAAEVDSRIGKPQRLTKLSKRSKTEAANKRR
jgi:DNA-binding transcriptional LysR family regulator